MTQFITSAAVLAALLLCVPIQAQTPQINAWRTYAARGNAEAQFLLGIAYVNGEGVPQDDAEAVRWFRLAAERGHPPAQFLLGLKYSSGEGIPKDDAEAVRWYRLAAEQGLAAAQSRLGTAYDFGEGVPEDNAEAVRWFRLAAEQGLAEAQFGLGFMYASGEGVPQDDAEQYGGTDWERSRGTPWRSSTLAWPMRKARVLQRTTSKRTCGTPSRPQERLTMRDEYRWPQNATTWHSECAPPKSRKRNVSPANGTRPTRVSRNAPVS